jgi:hypothetical protein
MPLPGRGTALKHNDIALPGVGDCDGLTEREVGAGMKAWTRSSISSRSRDTRLFEMPLGHFEE